MTTETETCHTHGYTPEKAAYLRRLRLIEGQVRGLARMVEEDQYCIDVLTQVTAVTSALKAVSLGLLEDHLSHCVADAARKGGPEGKEKIDEAMQAIKRLTR
ncbi:metal-sensitive transcriptional regulator [Tessaracoccus sp. MC1865]|uniref:metal-sensitive transcriptional regulator n=1 Tax=unclassified Tessaracoccus TaxID=2635419 RepID=UPI00096FD4B7|nr:MULTISPECIES: metal-sensitive transcriptional regulator [unclassified Tessaracoccus]MBB1483263.1 metal-sensitive transcriptional regulator [Tessaracoccus sp. MC1865]MBB1510305.1 metal-sensitive transcriptional regulator [Tessaracoccus sp. MC1756]MCG6568168.1 metal-sensitive transcriptional regulator [Tessaracoccus sp. ZS01]OMG54090.1 CopY family transcriptional regulator [Tessaracoccus sp. ZS01]QTO37326.1 metal-sensitive transcriptional regulator [Tessaracoccus sp. MC1865]